MTEQVNTPVPDFSVTDSPTDATNSVAEFVKPSGSTFGFDYLTILDLENGSPVVKRQSR